MIKLIGSVQGIKKHKKEYKMSALRTLLLICVSVFVGNIVLMLLDNAPMNIWIARVIGGIACATTCLLYTSPSPRDRLVVGSVRCV
ncbi:hypothetical protein KRV43_01860 [Staphylococcus xylosus]|uniref:hypothetical protein n=1 Tax=Staphylococcus xylosus TaxID=1288 RepID=UPI001C598966|nr:hypothetical protein [Staphylococcus xylosus]MBW3124700.1 hypothetical protein [Staphylococcus xylosus]